MHSLFLSTISSHSFPCIIHHPWTMISLNLLWCLFFPDNPPWICFLRYTSCVEWIAERRGLCRSNNWHLPTLSRDKALWTDWASASDTCNFMLILICLFTCRLMLLPPVLWLKWYKLHYLWFQVFIGVSERNRAKNTPWIRKESKPGGGWKRSTKVQWSINPPLGRSIDQ